MSESERKRFKVTRFDSKGKIMDITDCNLDLDLKEHGDGYAPKYTLNYTRYESSGDDHSSQAKTTHWIDESTLALLCHDILFVRKGMKTDDKKGYKPLLEEFKGGEEKEVGMVSRQFSVTYNDQFRIGPVYIFKFKKQPGELGKNRQVQPKKNSTPLVDESIFVKVQDARKGAKQVLDYILAKKTAAMMNIGSP